MPTLADYAEEWMRAAGFTIPARNTEEWTAFYEAWVRYAFGGTA
jgi:hypothetical protein